MILRALELSDMEPIRHWRNSCLDTLRTPFPLTKEQQEDWYRNEICNRNSRSRFWAVIDCLYIHNAIDTIEETKVIGYGGLENIQWENGIAEISLLIDPQFQHRGYGMQAAKDIIAQGFQNMGLKTIYGECYTTNKACVFWAKLADYTTTLPRRKMLNGQLVDSMYFSIHRG